MVARKASKADSDLSRRERQIMDVLYAQGRGSVAEVLEALPNPPGYSAVRALLRILEEKGRLKHTRDGNRYIYMPKRPRRAAARAAVKRLMGTFFEGSVEKTVAALLDASSAKLTEEEAERLTRLIEKAQEEQKS